MSYPGQAPGRGPAEHGPSSAGGPIGPGGPGGPVRPGRPIGPPPLQPEPDPGRALSCTGTALLVLSPVLVLLAGVVWALPRIPFVLGAGGNVAAYEEEFGGAMAVADVLSVCGLVLAALVLAAGIATLRIGRRRRRRTGRSAR